MRDVSVPAFWEELYAQGRDGWEMGRAAPPLVDLVEATPPPRGRVAVPGCGRGHDARLLARHGYDVTGFDFSPAAVSAAARAVSGWCSPTTCASLSHFSPPTPRRFHSMKTLRTALALALVLAVATTTAPSRTADAQGQTIKIGILYDHSGPFSAAGSLN